MRGKQGGRGMGDGRTKGDQGEEESLVAKLVTQYMQMGVVVLAIFPFIYIESHVPYLQIAHVALCLIHNISIGHAPIELCYIGSTLIKGYL